jgi:hypothetical protein
MRAPFDAMMVVTGAPEFELSKEEGEDLGEDCSLMLQFHGNIDPKTLVLVKLAGDFGSILATHWLMYRARVVKEAAEKRAEQMRGGEL